MNTIAQMRRTIDGEVFDYQVLLDALAGYRKPRDRITKLLAGGMIVRIKKGLYCFGEAFRREPISREYLANLIYGPSYVSLEYAMGYHGLIPERVESVTSVTTRRSRAFTTPWGISPTGRSGSPVIPWAPRSRRPARPFLMASPEKALADKVWTDNRFSGRRVSDV